MLIAFFLPLIPIIIIVNKNFMKLGFHHILCNNPEGGTLYEGVGGGLARLLGVWDFGWEKIFSKILIWTIVRGQIK